MKIVILAGGSGSRLWPMSRDKKPKQFCKLIGEKTILEDTLDRFSNFPKEKIFISTTRELLEETKELLKNFPAENFIVEPARRDTAPAMGFVATVLSLKDEDEPMMFIASDQYIGQTEKFLKTVQEAGEVVQETGKLLDISVYPTAPSTALGYTKIGKKVFERNDVEFYQFLGHVEKPDYKTAQKYLEEGNYLWHANFYTWTPKGFLEAYKKYAPNLFEKLNKIKKLLGDGKDYFNPQIEKIYSEMEKISIDYAVTEKMNPEDVLIIRGDFSWKDIGAWDVLHEILMTKTDEKNNLVRGKRLNIDTAGSIIYGSENKIIATIGVDDLVIIDTEDALLVCPKSRSQDVKKIIEKLKEKGKEFV